MVSPQLRMIAKQDTLYRRLFDDPSPQNLRQLWGKTKNTSKRRRLELVIDLLLHLRRLRNTSFILSGSTVWGKDEPELSQKKLIKPRPESDVDFLVISERYRLSPKIRKQKQASPLVISAWHKGELDQISLLATARKIRLSFTYLKPKLLLAACSLAPFTRRLYQYTRHKQEGLFYGYGFLRIYPFRYSEERRWGGYCLVDATNRVVAPDGRFMLGIVHNKIITGLPLVDRHRLRLLRKRLASKIYQKFSEEAREEECHLLNIFRHIISAWDPEYEKAIREILVGE